jgi:hypothetical protein
VLGKNLVNKELYNLLINFNGGFLDFRLLWPNDFLMIRNDSGVYTRLGDT